jgi:hypothetical protein
VPARTYDPWPGTVRDVTVGLEKWQGRRGRSGTGQRAVRTTQTGPGAKVIGRSAAVVNVVPPSAVGRDQRAW